MLTDITARSLLDHGSFMFKSRLGGGFDGSFVADLGGGVTASWRLDQVSLGGTNGVPAFTAAITCDPPLDTPDPDAPDQQPIFKTGSPYSCDLSLTPTAGADRRTVTKTFTVTTPNGPLVIRPATAMNTILQNDKNVGGFVFDNQDASPTTITGITFDVSYTALSTLDTPLVLRFIDGQTDQTLIDYHIENIPKSATDEFTHFSTNIVLPMTFSVGANTQKLLTVQVLGVHRMSITGVDPTVLVSLDGASTNKPNSKVALQAAQFKWKCVVPIGGYDPNATSGPFATGEACRN